MRLLKAAAVVTAAVAAIPLVYLAVRVAEVDRHRVAELLFQPRTGELLRNSLLLTATVTAASLVLGTASAWLVVRTDLPGRRVFAVLAALPLAIPTYVAGFSWISALPRFEGFGAAGGVLTLCCYPYVYLPTAAALRRQDPAGEEVSRALGVGPVATFRRVTLRQLLPALTAGGLLVALYVLSEFGAVSILRYDTFTRAIFTSFNAGFDRSGALLLAAVLVVITGVVVVAEGAATRRRHGYARLGGGAPRRAAPIRLGAARVPAAVALAVLAALALGVPAASLVYWTTAGLSTPESLGAVVTAATGSLWASAGGAALTLGLALPVGLLSARQRGLLPLLTERATWISHALPGVVIGLSLVFFGINVARPFYQTFPLLALAYGVLFLPLAVAAVRTAMLQCPRRLEEVARALGRRPAAVFATVTAPLIAPGLGAGAAMVFLTCMKELPATLLLRPTGFETLATQLWSNTAVGAYAAAAPYAALLVALSAVPAYLLQSRTGVLR